MPRAIGGRHAALFGSASGAGKGSPRLASTVFDPEAQTRRELVAGRRGIADDNFAAIPRRSRGLTARSYRYTRGDAAAFSNRRHCAVAAGLGTVGRRERTALSLRRETWTSSIRKRIARSHRLGTVLVRLAQESQSQSTKESAFARASDYLSEAEIYWRHRKPDEPETHVRTLLFLADAREGLAKKAADTLSPLEQALRTIESRQEADRAALKLSAYFRHGRILASQGKYAAALDATREPPRSASQTPHFAKSTF